MNGIGYNLADLITHWSDKRGFFGNLYCLRSGNFLLVFRHSRKAHTSPDFLEAISTKQFIHQKIIVYKKIT